MNEIKVLVPDVQFDAMDIEMSVTGNALTYQVFHEIDPDVIPDEIWADCDAVLAWHRMKIDARVIDKLKTCKLIVRVGVGFDNVDIDACRARGIPVSNVPNYGTTEVADHALAMLLSLVRGLDQYQDQLRADPTLGFVAENTPVVRRIRGSTFGSVGLGRIGTAVARRAHAFDMNVIFYDPYLPEGHDLAVGYERAGSLDELLRRADVVSLHVPLTDETRNMINAKTLALMKPNAILINVARGGVIDLFALESALWELRIEAAGLDVLSVEPPDVSMPLVGPWQRGEAWLKGRLIITPHAAFFSAAGYRDMRTFSAEILLSYFTKGVLRNNVNPGWSH